MKKYLILPFFLFFLVLTMPALAYLPVDINTTYTGGLLNNNFLSCTNLTGTFYCYKTGTDYPHLYIERYNATWGDRKSCTPLDAALGVWNGMYIVNSTHIGLHSWYYDNIYLIDVSNMTSNTCSNAGTISTSILNESEALDGYFNAGYYDAAGNGVSGWLYYPGSNGIRNSTTISYLAASFWNTDSIGSLRLPNQSDNSTMYGLLNDGSMFIKYSMGAFEKFSAQPSVTWGIEFTTYDWDLFKEGNTTWLYVNDKANGDLLRMNFTLADGLGDNYITAVSPRGNQTIADTTPELHAIVYSAYNGTVGWYMDGNFKANNTVTTDGISADVYFTISSLGTGNHYWKAYFYPSVGYSFDTGTQYFIVNTAYEGSDYTGPDIVEGFGSYLDSSLQTPYGGEIFALIFSGLVAGVIWYYSGSRKLEYLIAPMFFILACFSFIGLFPIWFLVLEVMVIAIFIFFKVR